MAKFIATSTVLEYLASKGISGATLGSPNVVTINLTPAQFNDGWKAIQRLLRRTNTSIVSVFVPDTEPRNLGILLEVTPVDTITIGELDRE